MAPNNGKHGDGSDMRTLLTGALAGAILCWPTAVAAQQPAFRIDPGPDAQEALQEALILVEPGQTVELGPGVFHMTEGLSLDVADVTVRGAGMDATVLSFKGQEGGSEGLLVTADRVLLTDFAVEDTKGDGIKVKGVDTITMAALRVEWTGGPSPDNGAYGLYPVESQNVLVDGCVVRGASDAGIYVGQSETIVVRDSRAEFNVAGIEIENSYHADVHDNVATRNTGGILVFDLPNLPQKGGHSVRVFDNQIVRNDTDNFAPPGNIVATVARGTGLLVMANRNVEVFDNFFSDNDTVHVLIATYPNDFDDDGYAPHPRGVHVHANLYGPGGTAPDKEMGKLIAGRVGTPVPDIVWDGVAPLTDLVFGIAAEDRIYIREAEGTSFANLRMVWETLLPWTVSPDRDIAAHAGSLPPVPAVRLPQDAADDAEPATTTAAADGG